MQVGWPAVGWPDGGTDNRAGVSDGVTAECRLGFRYL
jgi:hypothetical protein